MAFLRVKELSKAFRERKRTVEAVRGISFRLENGEMVGLLGPNGAGKTTTIKCILGLVKPDSGQIAVEGVDVVRDPHGGASRMAAVLEGARNTYWRLTVWENIVYFAGIHGVSLARGKEYFEYLLHALKLTEYRNTEVRNLSSGYKQKTAVACTLAKQTPLVFLDEPTLGLDVESSHELREALRKLQTEEGRTMVISSHDMRVIQDVCERVIIMSRGQIVCDDRVQSLLSLFATRKIRVVISKNEDEEAAELAQRGIMAKFPLSDVGFTKDLVEVTTSLTDAKDIYELVNIAKESGAIIETISQEEIDLEKAFLRVVRRGT